MNENGNVCYLDNYRPVHISYNPDGYIYAPKPPQVYDVWVRANVYLRPVQTTGSKLLDWLQGSLCRSHCYELVVSVVTGTRGERRTDSSHWYPFDTAREVKRQIEWERNRACGNGDFYFQNFTGELNTLFIELDWLAAK